MPRAFDNRNFAGGAVSRAAVSSGTAAIRRCPVAAGVVAAGGLNWDTDDKNVGPALDAFVKSSAETLPAADALPAWKWASAYYGALVTRISQVMAGELTLDEAWTRIDQDIADKVQQ